MRFDGCRYLITEAFERRLDCRQFAFDRVGGGVCAAVSKTRSGNGAVSGGMRSGCGR
jgi:hypothetical protein